MYKPSRKMPKTGHFIAIWTAYGKIFADTFKWEKHTLYRYNNHIESEWERANFDFPSTAQTNVIYAKLQED